MVIVPGFWPPTRQSKPGSIVSSPSQAVSPPALEYRCVGCRWRPGHPILGSAIDGRFNIGIHLLRRIQRDRLAWIYTRTGWPEVAVRIRISTPARAPGING